MRSSLGDTAGAEGEKNLSRADHLVGALGRSLEAGKSLDARWDLGRSRLCSFLRDGRVSLAWEIEAGVL